MIRTIVALIALSTSIAQAQQTYQIPWNQTAILPPVEFDHDNYPGVMTVTRLATEEEIRQTCASANFAGHRSMACNRRWGMSYCFIYIVADEVLATVGLTYEVAYRHERGHCNGWAGNHPGARYV